MSKGLFWAFFLFVCVTSTHGKNPVAVVPAPDEEQQIDRMFDMTNRLRAQRRIPILGLDARLCHAATVHAEEMARYNYISDGGPGIFPCDRTRAPELWPVVMPGQVSQRRFVRDLRTLAPF
jgi:uncharacterized protein YkwD